MTTQKSDNLKQWDKDLAVIQAMQKFGGSFVKSLGVSCLLADKNNLERLKKAFPEYWEKYARYGNKKEQ